MELISPNFGLMLWMTISALIIILQGNRIKIYFKKSIIFAT